MEWLEKFRSADTKTKVILGAGVLAAIVLVIALFNIAFAPSLKTADEVVEDAPVKLEAIPHGQFGDMKFPDRVGYKILYFQETKRFQITITDPPFDEFRQAAEQDFLRVLDINEQQACRLDVTIRTPLYANPNLAGQVFFLSFCKEQ
ncbi:MAG: hypothetical protein WD850_02700 [Candidatus Spechtbacterales bacterium]